MAKPLHQLRTEFSPHTRGYNLARLRAELFDVLIIGGGVTGASIAREASLRGFKVALLERSDFGAASSFKLVPGGARYLDGFQLRGGLGTSRERERLMELAPSEVRPLPVNYPIYRDSPYNPSLVGLGLVFYQLLALFPAGERYRRLELGEYAGRFPGMDVRSVVCAMQHLEAVADEGRLALDLLRAANRLGAVIVNHIAVAELTRSTGKRLDGVRAHDLLVGEYIDVRARIIVNATGPWLDSILTLDESGKPQNVISDKLVYLLLPHAKVPVEQGTAFRFREDRNWMYLLPRSPYTVIGPLEVEHSGPPEDALATPPEVDYILRAVNKEFPGYHIAARDVVSVYTGLRPLVRRGDHLQIGPLMWASEGGVNNVVGGDLAANRSLAFQFVDRAVKLLDVYGVRPSVQAKADPLVPVLPGTESAARAQREALESLPASTRDYLSDKYGPRLPQLLEYLRADQKLGASIVDGYPFIWAQVPYAMEYEMAVTVADVMVRRLDLFHLVPDGAVWAAAEVARYMGRTLEWLDPDLEAQVDSYARAVRRNRQALGREG